MTKNRKDIPIEQDPIYRLGGLIAELENDFDPEIVTLAKALDVIIHSYLSANPVEKTP